MRTISEYLKPLAEKTGLLVIAVIALLATSYVLGVFVVLDGRTVSGDSIIVASAILVGATLITPAWFHTDADP